MLTIIPVILTAGVVSMLVTFSELVPFSPYTYVPRHGAVAPGPAHSVALSA